MTDAMDRRDALADALADRDWEVLDTFGGLRESPAIAVRVDDVDIAGETFEQGDLTITVVDGDVTADRVSISDDDLDLTEAQRELLDDVCDEKLSGPEMTVWDYVPGSEEDNIDEVLEELRRVYDEVTPI
ncbi:hypothetical protein [Haloparvum sp. PAK95]|uniref:hypothetical protein n=1 Tax=Haloparvum sp. PAK95 TaxID=3418962 RepID=UPI003D2ED0D5